MRERVPLEILRAEGSPNLRRSLKREAAEAALTLTPETRSEIERLDELIALSMRACKRGQTFRGKPNPAFEHVAKLIKARDVLRKGKAHPGKVVEDAQGFVDDVFKKAGIAR